MAAPTETAAAAGAAPAAPAAAAAAAAGDGVSPPADVPKVFFPVVGGGGGGGDVSSSAGGGAPGAEATSEDEGAGEGAGDAAAAAGGGAASRPSGRVRAVVVDGGGVILNGMPVPMLRALVGESGPLADLSDADKAKVVGAHKSNYSAWTHIKVEPAYTEAEYWAELAKGTPLEGHTEVDAAALGRALRESFKAYPDVLAVVRDARDQAGATVGVVSNHATGWFGEMADSFGLKDVFDEDLLIVSQTVECAKPDKAIWDIMMERLRRAGGKADAAAAELKNEDVVFVDDKPANIDAVVAYGCRGILFDNTKHSADQLRAALVEAGVVFAPASK